MRNQYRHGLGGPPGPAGQRDAVLPADLPGLPALWGKSVFQCPFCHGWEMRDKRLPSLAAGEEAVLDSLHRTSAAAIFAAGDVCTEQPYVAGSIAAGAQAAMIIVQSLLADEYGMPYPPTAD